MDADDWIGDADPATLSAIAHRLDVAADALVEVVDTCRRTARRVKAKADE